MRAADDTIRLSPVAQTVRLSAPLLRQDMRESGLPLRCRIPDCVSEVDAEGPRKRWPENAHPQVRGLHIDLSIAKPRGAPATHPEGLPARIDEPSPFEEPTAHRPRGRHSSWASRVGGAKVCDHPFRILAIRKPRFRMKAKAVPGVRAGAIGRCTTSHPQYVGFCSQFAPGTDCSVDLPPVDAKIVDESSAAITTQIVAVTVHDAQRDTNAMGHEEDAARARSSADRTRVPQRRVVGSWHGRARHTSSMPCEPVSSLHQDCAVFATLLVAKPTGSQTPSRRIGQLANFRLQRQPGLLLGDLQQFTCSTFQNETASVVGGAPEL